MDTIFEVLGKAFSWLGAVLGPINERINDALREWTDFDFAQTTLLPAIFLVVAGGAFVFIGWAPRAGLDAVVTWALYTSSDWPVIWLGLVILAVIILCGLLLIGGHWLLLKLWMLMPLGRMSRYELPYIDYERVNAVLASARDNLAKAKEAREAEVRKGIAARRGKPAAEGLKPLQAKVDECTVLTANVELAAAAFHGPPVGVASPAAATAGAAKAKDEEKTKKEDDTVGSTGKIFAAMIEGLRPGYVQEILALSATVGKFQTGFFAAIDDIVKAVETTTWDAEFLDALDGQLKQLQGFANRVAGALSKRFGEDSWLPDDAWKSRVYANSLAFNLAGTTLERWRDRGPVNKWLERRKAETKAAAGTDFESKEWRDLLERLRKSRSSIVTFTTLASVLVVWALAGLVACFSVAGQFTGLAHWLWAVLFSAIVLGLVLVGIVKVFIEPIVIHAFYVSIVEGRLRNKLGAAPQVAPGRLVRLLRRLSMPVVAIAGFTAAAAIVVLPATLYWIVSGAYGLDNRLVVVAARDLGRNEGITRRNMSDLVDVVWRPCTPTPAPWAEVSPARLVGTFMIRACGVGKAFAAADLVVRPQDAAVGNPPAAGVACKGEPFAESRPEPSPPPLEAMCRTTVNAPAKPEKGTSAQPTVVNVDLNKLVAAVADGDKHTQESLANIVKAIDALRDAASDLNVKVDIKPEIIAKLEALIQILIGRKPEGPIGTPHHIGTVYFNFACEDLGSDRACAKPTDGQVSKSQSCAKLEETRAQTELGKLAEAMKHIDPGKTATTDVLVVGWADHAGPFDLNRRLAASRALKIKERLEAKLPAGMKNHLHHFGIGEGTPDTDECDPRRRRADLYLIRSE
ncbi:MAG: hypothetical protein HYX38_16785 [Rhodospirillales bacterium]|nr:hypothetical protein [Rhodospirillales bacterium]